MLTLVAPGASRAGWQPLLPKDGEPLCAHRPLTRTIRAVLPDGSGGHFLIAHDASAGFGFPFVEEINVHLIHVDRDFLPIPIGDLYLSGDPCGVPIVGGRGPQLARAALPLAGGIVLLTGIDVGVPANGDQPRVFYHAVDADGRGVFAPSAIHLASPGIDADLPLIAVDGDGGFLLAWHENLDGEVGFDRLLVQRFDAAGDPLWNGRGIVVRDGVSGIGDTVLAADQAGGAWLVWREWNEEPPDFGFVHQLQRIAPTGRAVGGDGVRRLLQTGRADIDVSIAPVGQEDVIVVYSSGGLRAQRFDGATLPLWGEAGLLISDPLVGALRRQPGIVWDDERLYITWIESGGGFPESILARRIRADGSTTWPSPVSALSGGRGVLNRQEAILADGSLALVWEESRDPGGADPADVFAQVIDPRGRTKGPPDGVPIGAAVGAQRVPHIAPIAEDGGTHAGAITEGRPGAIFIWSDSRLDSLAPGPSDSFFIQRVEFFSSPRLERNVSVSLRQGESITIDLRGDDLHPEALIDPGPGIAVESSRIESENPEAPGDRVTLTLRVDDAAALGLRGLRITNPDGGTVFLQDLLRVDLEPRRIDVDGSGRVDGFDLALLARAFGSNAEDPLYLMDADIDADGLVDGIDLALLASRFGRPPEPTEIQAVQENSSDA